MLPPDDATANKLVTEAVEAARAIRRKALTKGQRLGPGADGAMVLEIQRQLWTRGLDPRWFFIPTCGAEIIVSSWTRYGEDLGEWKEGTS